MPKPRLIFTPEQQQRIRDGRAASPPVHLKALAQELRCSVFRVWCEVEAQAGRSVVRVQQPHTRPQKRPPPQMHPCMRCRTRLVPGWGFCRICKSNRGLMSDSPFDR